MSHHFWKGSSHHCQWSFRRYLDHQFRCPAAGPLFGWRYGFLTGTPIPIHAVFITKLLQAILPNFGLICLFSLPLLFGLGAAGNYNFLYYPLVVVVLAAMALSAASLSALLVMLIVRVVPARRVAEIIGFATATISIICSQSGQFARFSNFSRIQATAAWRRSPIWPPPGLPWPGPDRAWSVLAAVNGWLVQVI